MAEGRRAVPTALARQVKEEAGYRCAIPACRSSDATDIAHIEPWAEVREHYFHNLILLCANDHRRFDAGEIRKASIRRYKANLSVINGRYDFLEQRVLQWFADNGLEESVRLPAYSDLLVSFLVRDGLLTPAEPVGNALHQVKEGKWVPMSVGSHVHRLTEAGKTFVTQWLSAEPLE